MFMLMSLTGISNPASSGSLKALREPLVAFPHDLQYLCWRWMSKELTLSQGGIQMLGLPYGCVDFKTIVSKHGHGLKLLCKWDPDDVSKLYVRDPDTFAWYTRVPLEKLCARAQLQPTPLDP